ERRLAGEIFKGSRPPAVPPDIARSCARAVRRRIARMMDVPFSLPVPPLEEVVMPSVRRRGRCRKPACALALLVSVAGFAGGDQPGWVDPLAGGDLAKHWTTTGNWKLDGGVASLRPRPGEKGWERYEAYLWSKKQYKEFEAEFEYQVEKGGNSGFYFHVGDP